MGYINQMGGRLNEEMTYKEQLWSIITSYTLLIIGMEWI
jgi:hypothetical protein